MSEDRSAKVLVVGAGPAGLVTGRALRRAGVPFDIVERHTDVGGIWDPANPGSPMYESAHFISSSRVSGFSGFPMPKNYPDYPHNREILSYIKDFADAYGLRKQVETQCAVEQAEPQGTDWEVRLSNGQTRRYGALVCAPGETWQPTLPDYPGTFNGETLHSAAYRSTDEFKGKRVLIVGAGNSGCDIACDAAGVAARAMISVRRGYHFVPKHVFGMPADEFAARGPQLPTWMTRPVLSLLLKMVTGDPSQYGFPKPDHKLFESHPILNTQILHCIGHGLLHPKPDIERLDGDGVVFKDGTRETLDLILYATGYRRNIPYIADAHLDFRGKTPDFAFNTFSRKHPSLFSMSIIETNSGAYPVFELMAHCVAQHLADRGANPARAEQLRLQVAQFRREHVSGGLKFVDSDRHHVYVDSKAFRKSLRKLVRRMGWPELDADFYAPQAVTQAA